MARKGLPAILCGVAVLASSQTLEAGMPSESALEAVVSDAWRRVEPRTTGSDPLRAWHVRLTPPFPVIWPPVKEPRFDYYAYAYRRDPALADGEHVAAPWARIRVRWLRDEDPELVLLTEEPRAIGVQGVRPLEEEEQRIQRRRDEVEGIVLGLNTLPHEEHADKVRAFYCLWLRSHDKVAALVSPRHPSFVRWLDCR